VVLGVGTTFTVGIDTQRTMPLQAPLQSVVPLEIAGFVGQDIEMGEPELRVAGVTSYLMRDYEPDSAEADSAWFSLYVGYYDRQTRGRTIHSPKNCLPGGGWEALTSREVMIGPATANRYLLQKGNQQVLVLYWYQGRGRVQANEYLVKWDLLRDAALRQRSEEALVRIVVPIDGGEQEAYDLAAAVARRVIVALEHALPN
jgi:EpsI family protein